VPYKRPQIEKVFYTIGEVAEMFTVNTSTIRFWEREFEMLKPHKNKKGNRLFTKDVIEG
jgi:DNA-binding transcriptional MerR regulator